MAVKSCKLQQFPLFGLLLLVIVEVVAGLVAAYVKQVLFFFCSFFHFDFRFPQFCSLFVFHSIIWLWLFGNCIVFLWIKEPNEKFKYSTIVMFYFNVCSCLLAWPPVCVVFSLFCFDLHILFNSIYFWTFIPHGLMCAGLPSKCFLVGTPHYTIK